MTDNRLNRRWELVVLGILVNTCLGTVYSWSVFRAPLELVLGISPGQSGIPYSVFLGAFAFTMPIGGMLIPRIGSRPTLLLGGILVGAGWIAAGTVSSFAWLVVTYGIVGGVGVGLAYGVPLAVAASWFPDKRGLAMGLTLAGFGVSPFVTAPVAELLILQFGVQPAMVYLGISFTVVVAALFWIFRTAETESAGARDRKADLTTGEMVRTGRFYILWITYALGTLAGLTAIGMTASYAQQGLLIDGPAAALAVSAFGIFNGIGRPLFGMLHDRSRTRTTIVLAFALIAVGSGFAYLATPGLRFPFYVGFTILWLMLGGWLAIAPAATVRLFGPSHYTRNYGLMYTAYGVGALTGGALSGLIFEAVGSYRLVFPMIAGLCVVGATIAMVGLREQPIR
jgi:OFA family oxalate/formate antiporter-like MFS transporter